HPRARRTLPVQGCQKRYGLCGWACELYPDVLEWRQRLGEQFLFSMSPRLDMNINGVKSEGNIISETNQRQEGGQQDGAADGSQPFRSETTRMSSAAGSRR